MRNTNINARTAAAKQLLSNPDIKKEVQLVYDAKKNPYDMTLWSELYRTFQPVVNAAILSSGVARLNLGSEEIQAQAQSILIDAVMKYDINVAAAKPSTYFSAILSGELSKTKRAGRMISGTDKNESMKVLVNKAENILRKQGLPSDPASVKNFLEKNGHKFTKSEISKAQRFNTFEYSGSQSVGDEDSSVAGEMTYQDTLDARSTKTPAELLSKRNRLLHVYNKLPGHQDKEFMKAVFWLQDDAIGLGQPAALIGRPKPKNFKELCGIYRMGYERGKKIYQTFLREENELL